MRLRNQPLGSKNLIGARVESARKEQGMKQKELLAQLQVNGTDVMEAGVRPGRDVGRVLSRLLDEVMRGILLNERSVLLARLRTMIQEESAEDEESETVR